MNKLFIIIFLLCNSCAALPDYTTRHNLLIYDKTTVNTPTQQEIEEVTEYVIKYLGSNKIDGIRVYLYNKWIQVPQPDNKAILADGYTDIWEGVIIASVLQDCFADSGMVHELAHIVHDYGEEAPDWWHDDKEFWDMIKEMEKQIVLDLCPEGYEHKEIPADYTDEKK